MDRVVFHDSGTRARASHRIASRRVSQRLGSDLEAVQLAESPTPAARRGWGRGGGGGHVAAPGLVAGGARHKEGSDGDDAVESVALAVMTY
ncbi:unnamed protein product [Lampetra fluviatilis]